MDRESIILEMARTLFVSAYADGVEAGAIDGPAAGGGEDWMDIAPNTGGEGSPEMAKAREIADRFDETARTERRRYVVTQWGGSGSRSFESFEDLGDAVRRYTELADRIGLENEEPPVGAPDALFARAERGPADGAIRGWTLLRDLGTFSSYALATGGLGLPPLELAAMVHAMRTGTDRFAHCLAMEALGHGVGLEDDLPVGVRLPGWIRASVPSIEFSFADLDPERFPIRDEYDSEGE